MTIVVYNDDVATQTWKVIFPTRHLKFANIVPSPPKTYNQRGELCTRFIFIRLNKELQNKKAEFLEFSRLKRKDNRLGIKRLCGPFFNKYPYLTQPLSHSTKQGFIIQHLNLAVMTPHSLGISSCRFWSNDRQRSTISASNVIITRHVSKPAC